MRLGLWEHRLADLLVGAQERPFCYGEFDCCLFAAEAVQVLTGADPAASLRGTYSTEEEAAVILEPYGGVKGLAELTAWELGFSEVAPLLAQRGDIILAEINGRQTLGVCIGSKVAFPRPDTGLAYIPIDSRTFITAWRVG